MNAPASDRLRVLLTFEAAVFEAAVTFYCEVLSFEVEYRRAEDTATLVGLRLDGTRLILATPGALGIGPPAPTSDATVILMHPDVSAHRGALTARYDGALGPVRAMGDGAFYELQDPGGNRVWIMQVD